MDQAIALGEWERFQEHAIHHREDRRVGADAEREGGDGDGGITRSPKCSRKEFGCFPRPSRRGPVPPLSPGAQRSGTFSGTPASQETVDAQVLIEGGPMNAFSLANQLPAVPFGRTGFCQSGIPLDRNANPAAIGKRHHQVVVGETDGGSPGCRKISWRRTHSSNVGEKVYSSRPTVASIATHGSDGHCCPPSLQGRARTLQCSGPGVHGRGAAHCHRLSRRRSGTSRPAARLARATMEHWG